jgi:hypothetical protein
MKTNKYVDIVNRIPVDQTAAATDRIKRYLLEVTGRIIERKKVIEQATRDKKRNDVLEAYKKSVGFEKKQKLVEELKYKLAKSRKELIDVGLTEEGQLIHPTQRSRGYGETTWQVRDPSDSYSYIDIDDATADRIWKVDELLQAVEGEVQPFDIYEQMRARMMLASTVGETMAIVNALLGEEVFMVNLPAIGLQKTIEDKKG